jgi:hypothetical protein
MFYVLYQFVTYLLTLPRRNVVWVAVGVGVKLQQTTTSWERSNYKLGVEYCTLNVYRHYSLFLLLIHAWNEVSEYRGPNRMK